MPLRAENPSPGGPFWKGLSTQPRPATHHPPLVPVSDRHLVNHHPPHKGPAGVGFCWRAENLSALGQRGWLGMKTWPGRGRRWPHHPGELKPPDCGGCDMSMVLPWPVGTDPRSVADGPADAGKGA